MRAPSRRGPPVRAGEPGGAWRVVVVDDQALVVSAFEMLLNAQADLEVAGSAADGAAALALLRRLRLRGRGADVVLMDIRMPVMDGVEAIGAMRAEEGLREIPVLVLTTFDEEELVLGALRAGARGFLLKDASPGLLLEAVRTVAAGGSWLDPAVTGTVLAHLDDDAPPGPAAVPASGPAGESPARSGPGSAAGAGPIAGAAWAAGPGTGLAEPVTLREREVLTLVCEGLPNAEIGERLHLAESTVKTHIKALLAKTGRRNRVELIVHAFRHGLVDYRR
ncbi:response regulator [Actinomyces dentalis]|uniref:response regulator n=1 Tax=Actinomyces dentalis TaxID=272548 RepID=UPI0036F206DE